MVQLIGIPRPVNYFCPPASHAYTRTNPPLPRHPLLKGPMNTLRSRRQTLEASWNFNTAGFLSESDSKCYLNMSIGYACACTQRCSVSARTFPANVTGISSKNLNQASDEKRDLAGQCFPPPLFLTPLFKASSRKIDGYFTRWWRGCAGDGWGTGPRGCRQFSCGLCSEAMCSSLHHSLLAFALHCSCASVVPDGDSAALECSVQL